MLQPRATRAHSDRDRNWSKLAHNGPPQKSRAPRQGEDCQNHRSR